ncbi:MAG: DinB family protein [Melioribacteraceae bacterium]|nr:DinB family protein [Melioribacteraceae bacterium]MCF8262983.1 DinB family protein [Melioribacteraceae bacterium]MCF8430584.1 DinB family protein [Melioribacteraceae bacterium]
MYLINSLKTLIEERKLLLRGLESLSEEKYFIIPQNFKNNIAWNLGHIIVTQQFLHYSLSRLELQIPKEFVSYYRTGTSPANWKENPNITELKETLIELPHKFIADFESGRFKEFRPYKTSTGISLDTLEQAVTFNHFHEGVHTGIILNLMKNF